MRSPYTTVVGKSTMSTAIITNDLVHAFLWNHGRIRRFYTYTGVFPSNIRLASSQPLLQSSSSLESLRYSNNHARFFRIKYNNNTTETRLLSSWSDNLGGRDDSNNNNKQTKFQSKFNDPKNSSSNQRNTKSYNNNNGTINRNKNRTTEVDHKSNTCE